MKIRGTSLLVTTPVRIMPESAYQAILTTLVVLVTEVDELSLDAAHPLAQANSLAGALLRRLKHAVPVAEVLEVE